MNKAKIKNINSKVWVWDMLIFWWLGFILVHRSQPKTWAAVVPRSNYLILAVDLRDSSAQYLVRRAVDTSLGLSVFTSTILLPMASVVYLGNKKPFLRPYMYEVLTKSTDALFFKFTGESLFVVHHNLKAILFFLFTNHSTRAGYDTRSIF